MQGGNNIELILQLLTNPDDIGTKKAASRSSEETPDSLVELLNLIVLMILLTDDADGLS